MIAQVEHALVRTIDSLSGVVLVVEDDAGLRCLTTELLRTAGHEAVAVSSVEEAITFLRSVKVSLVLSDYALGPATGLQLLVHVRRFYESMPFILMSGDLPDLAARRAAVLGADRLDKPFSPSRLREVIAGQLSRVVATAGEPIAGPPACRAST